MPAELPAVEAAPLMCAGLTTFNALRNSAARPGDVVAVLGLGGLGHLGVQYAVKMGFHAVGIARGKEIRCLSLEQQCCWCAWQLWVLLKIEVRCGEL